LTQAVAKVLSGTLTSMGTLFTQAGAAIIPTVIQLYGILTSPTIRLMGIKTTATIRLTSLRETVVRLIGGVWNE